MSGAAKTQALLFMNYLTTPEARKIIAAYGFTGK
jgi:ABC-type molybdate transport system substrate-binding protein